MGVARKERVVKLQTAGRFKKNATNKQRNSMKMMQESLTSKYNKLLSFRHEGVIVQNLEEVLQSVHQRSVYLDYSYTFLQALVFEYTETCQKGRDTSVINDD